MPLLDDDQLAVWKQLQWATALIMARFRRDLAGSGLSLEEFDVLVHLAWAPSQTLALHELAASMVVADALSRSELIYLLVSLDKRYTAEGPDEPWERYYAREIVDHFRPR